MGSIGFRDDFRKQMTRKKNVPLIDARHRSRIVPDEHEWCRKSEWCIATVRRIEPRRRRIFVNSLFPIAVRLVATVGMRFAGETASLLTGCIEIRALKVENSVRIAGALSLLAALRRGGRAGGKRARENPGSNATRRLIRDAGEETCSSDDTETGGHKRCWLWLDVAMTGLWVALLLSVVAYAVVGGEAALAKLDGLALVAAYSMAP